MFKIYAPITVFLLVIATVLGDYLNEYSQCYYGVSVTLSDNTYCPLIIRASVYTPTGSRTTDWEVLNPGNSTTMDNVRTLEVGYAGRTIETFTLDPVMDHIWPQPGYYFSPISESFFSLPRHHQYHIVISPSDMSYKLYKGHYLSRVPVDSPKGEIQPFNIHEPFTFLQDDYTKGNAYVK